MFNRAWTHISWSVDVLLFTSCSEIFLTIYCAISKDKSSFHANLKSLDTIEIFIEGGSLANL
jgi:hypothetical protein